MDYCLYKLSFTTALHIGKDNAGPSLDNGQMAIHADTLFAALCSEAARAGHLEFLVNHFRAGHLVISDALPYNREDIFLPKPILFLDNKQREGDSGLKKKLKKIEYIPLSKFDAYLRNLSATVPDLQDLEYGFGQLSTLTRVAIKGNEQPMPYHVAAWEFAEGCGLYIIAGVNDPKAQEIFAQLLVNLGYTGIGGKQSSGWGKYDVEQHPVPESLNIMLGDQQASYQMLLGTALPVDEQLDDILAESWYTLLRRGGFVRSETYADTPLKKRTLYMLGPGSCLRQRFRGGMFDLSDHGAHPVWRCGNTLFVGVNV